MSFLFLFFGGVQISGHGLALAAVNIEQDSAYWEVHIKFNEGEDKQDILVGLATKKDKKFFELHNDEIEYNNKDDEYRKKNGIEYMSKITVSNGDVVGVVIQQSDLPMIQFYLNGQQLYDASINRFRGSVYPSFFLPQSANVKLKVVFLERDFAQPIPSHNCSPVIVARGLM